MTQNFEHYLILTKIPLSEANQVFIKRLSRLGSRMACQITVASLTTFIFDHIQITGIIMFANAHIRQ
jgi:hypothetical protein